MYRSLLLTALIATTLTAAETFPWQRDYATTTPEGDLVLKQEPYRYQAGETVRYIDYAQGSDDNDGSRAAPWKHHPWDARFSGETAGADTYVFKGGVVYRGKLAWPDQGGSAERPIRLTRDPEWGEGPAILAGSRQVTQWRRGADHPKIPDAESVWVAEADWVVANLWWVQSDGTSRRIPIARTPNWTDDGVDVTEDWWSWTNDSHPFKPPKGWSAQDSKHLKGKPKDFVEGAYVYSEYGWVMGYPGAAKVRKFDPGKGRVNYTRWTGGGRAGVGSHIVFRGHRYYLENKPHYLDDPTGEFWVDRGSKKIYLRLPDGVDPNDERIEAGKQTEIIDGKDARHIVVSGLDFRWVQQHPDFDTNMYTFGSNGPDGFRTEHHNAAVRFWQNAQHVTISHCTFEDVNTGVLGIARKSKGDGCVDIAVTDSRFVRNVANAVFFKSWPKDGGLIDDVRIYRNHMQRIGYRAPRYFRGWAIYLQSPRRSHVAGNIIEDCAGQGINIYGPGGPFARQLVHQNKVWESMQHGNDYGGIEFWQHGPAYIFNNISYDPRGQVGMTVGREHGFGHAYYLDGGFKCHLFNNIAWGASNDPKDPRANRAGFQEIHSFQNQIFNNSIFRFNQATRRQAPQAGRGKYLGNVMQDIDLAFWHSKPPKGKKAKNEHHVGREESRYDDGTNAYALNVFHDIGTYGTVDSQGRRFATFADFRQALEEIGTMATSLGTESGQPPLRDPGAGDWRLREDSPAIDHGARVFVPWAVAGVVAEWNFYPAGTDHTRIVDEHWTRAPYIRGRKHYHHMPRFPLRAVNVDRDDFVPGPLENYVTGCLELDPARRQYAFLAHADLVGPFTVNGKETIAGDQVVNPEIQDQDLLIEVYFKADSDGILVSKMDDAGYRLVLEDGRATFAISGEGARAEITSRAELADGDWHHLVAEADRDAETLTLYVDGREDHRTKGLGPVSLANGSDLTVGGSPEGGHLAGSFEFMRIARGTLADSLTTIEELHAWQFHGPHLRDFTGAPPTGAARDAGALEHR